MSVCYFHSSDLDGHCSGAIIKLKYPDCKMVGINYGDDFEWDFIDKGETVFMVDFCMQPFSDMIKLNEKAKLIWIDHHKTAIDEYKKSGIKIKGIQEIGIGACALVWQWCHPGVDIPEAIQLLAEYDVWNHSNPKTLPFQYGLRINKTWPDFEALPLWDQLINYRYADIAVKQICSEGRTILRYEEQSNEMYMKVAFEKEFEGLNFLVVNRMYTNSKIFDSKYDAKRHDAMMTFGWTGETWRFGLYTDKKGVDVSAVAKKYGGGGHVQAAGFQSKKLPFKLEKGE